jgi:hypothetical protein
VHVRVHEAGASAIPRQRERDVRRDGGLADAALARGDRHDVRDARERRGALHRRGLPHARGERQIHAAQARDRSERRAHVGLDLVLERAGRRRELDVEIEVAAGDLGLLDHLRRDEIDPHLGIDHGLQGRHHARLQVVGAGHGCGVYPARG